MCEDSTDALSRTLCSAFSTVLKAGDNVESIAPRSTPYARLISEGNAGGQNERTEEHERLLRSALQILLPCLSQFI